ncbi:MAG: hypothetical protein KGL53_04685, partial [Elusimicrobia bacterium]|nr:hypothetical protein [Elusimicrobiota bacterium]
TAVTDAQDTLYAAAASLLPSALFRNDQNIPVLKIQLWTASDFITLDQLSLATTGSAPASSANQVKFYLDDGDGVFDPTKDASLAPSASFVGGKATFSFVGAGTSQTVGTSTKTYFIAWNISGSATNGADLGVTLDTTDFVLSGSTDIVSPLGFPLKSSTSPIVAAQALVTAETATGTWVNVSSIVFSASFGSGNINHLHWRWDEAPATSVDGTEVPAWSAGKTTVTATTDAQDWYFHARAFDALNSSGTQVDVGPYWVDRTLPTGSAFLSFNSTSGALAESQFSDLAAGVTAQLTVSDAASGLSLSGPAPLATSSGTVSLWHLDEAAGTWADSGPAGNTLTAAAGAGRGPGRFGGGLLLDGGASSYAQQASPSGLPTGAAARSLEAWVEPASSTGVHGIVSYGTAGCGNQIDLGQSGLGLYADTGCGGFATAPALSTGVWQHVALTYDGSAVTLYAGGVMVGSGTVGGLTTAAGALSVGQLVGGSAFQGGIDEVRVSSGAYGAAEVAAHAQRGDPYYASYSSDAGRSWTVVASTASSSAAHVALTGAQGTTAPQTLTITGMGLVVSTYTLTGARGTDEVRFHFADIAGNVRTAGPFTVLVDTNAGVAVSTPSLPAPGAYVGTRPDFYWTAPSTTLVQGLGGVFLLQVSSADSSFSPANVVVSISTPELVADPFSPAVTGVYLSTFTLGEGTTYYWRVRSQSYLGVLGPWGPTEGFVTDKTSPTVSGFTVYNSTGGVFGESGPIDLLSGVTVQLLASDAVAGLSRPRDAVLPSGAVAYWPFGEREGAAPVDAAQGITAAAVCGTSGCYRMTPFGAGLHLGGGQYMSAANAAFHFASTTSFSVSAWVKPSFVGGGLAQTIAAVGAPQTAAGSNWAFWINTTGLLSLTNSSGGGAFSPSGLLAPGAWQQVAVAVNGTHVWFYVNGVLKSAQSWAGNDGGGAMPFSVGAGIRADGVTPEAFFNGDLDEVKVFSRALTAPEVASDYADSSRGRFAVEVSSTAGRAWQVVSATSPAAGWPYVSQSGADGSTAQETMVVRDLSFVQSTSTLTGAAGTDLVRFISVDRRGNYAVGGPFTVIVDTVAAAAVSTPTLPSPGVYASTTPVFAWDGPSTATLTGMGASARFLLEVSQVPDFSSTVVSITTPVVAASTGATFTQGVYVPTAPLAHGTTYYWRVRAQDYLGVYSPALTATSFVTDFSTPVTSAYYALSSTGGLVSEGVGLALASGVTAQVTLQDSGPSGLALSAQDGAAPFGVMYTTLGAQALPTWVDGTWGAALTAAGETSFQAMAKHQGQLWAATSVNGQVWHFNGTTWGLSTTLGGPVDALESFNGSLYAAMGGSGQVWRFDGTSWSLNVTLAAGGSVDALKAYGGRLYAGDTNGRVWGFEPTRGQWFLAYQSTSAVVESLGVYNGRLFAGANPNIYVYDGTAWDVSAYVGGSIKAFADYDNKLFAATNNLGRVYQYDGAAWAVSYTPNETQDVALAVHGGRLYAGASQPSVGRVYAFDTKSWALVQQFPTQNDYVTSMDAFGGNLYLGMHTSAGDAQVLVSTPLAVSLTGADGTVAAQTLAVKGLSLIPSASAAVCGGNASCTATNQVRFSAQDLSGRVGQAGPYAVLVDTLLTKPTVYYPAAGSVVRDGRPDFTWVEASTMPTHVVQVSTAPDFSALQVNQTVTGGGYVLTSPLTLNDATTYYWRVQAKDQFGVPSDYSDTGAFFEDRVAPSTGTYLHFGSTAGALGETQFTNLASGATYTLTVRDPGSGLALTPLRGLSRVAAYSFEGSGNTVQDLSGAGRTATLGLSTLRTGSGYRGAGLTLAGAGGAFLPAPGIATWTGLAAEAWAKPTANNTSQMTVAAGGQFRLQAYSAQGRVSYEADTTGGGGCGPLVSSQTYPLGAWEHVAFVMDPGANKNELFVNGQLAASCAGAGGAVDQGFSIGIDTVSGLGPADGFQGGLDEVRLYSGALSAADVAAEMLDAPFAVLYSTNAGASWSAAASTGPAGPRLAFTGASGSTGWETVSAVDLPLRQSTSAVTCGQSAPCGATDQLMFLVPDEAGSLRQAGPFAVLIDTSAPAPTLTSLTPTATDQLFATLSSTYTDDLAGSRDFLFEASTASDFTGSLSSSGYVAQTTYTFTGLSDATTYFVRAYARDVLLNVSTPSVSQATSTFGSVFVATAAAAPASALQGALVPMITLDVNTSPGSTSRLLSLTVRKTGTTPDSDVDQVQLYSDNGDGIFESASDALVTQSTLTAGVALLTLPGVGSPLTVAVSTFHVVLKMNSGAITANTVGVEISSAQSVGLLIPGHAFGPFPVTAGPLTVTDGANNLDITPTNLAASAVQPGTNDFPVLQLLAQADPVGTSIISSVTLTLSGTLPSNKIRSINLWRDAPPLGIFDANTDIRMTNDTDIFGAFTTATMSVVGFDVSSRTVTTTQQRYFVTVSLAPDAPQDSTFRIAVASTQDITLQNLADTVVFVSSPVISSTVSVVLNNTLTASATDQTPAAFVQGERFAVLRATMSVDVGAASVNRLTVRRTGTGQDSDVSAVEVWRQANVDGSSLNPLIDVMIGSAPFASGLASVRVTTQTLVSGTTGVFFVSYLVSPSATPGVTLGLKMSTGDVTAGNTGTTVTGVDFLTADAPVQATVNHMLIVNAVKDVSPGSLLQGQPHVAMLRLDVQSDKNDFVWTSLSVERLGTASDADVSAVNLYQDYNGDGVFEADIDTKITNGGLFSGTTATLSLTPSPTVTGAARSYFVALDVAASATPGTTLGVRISSTSSFNLISPNVVSTATAFPIQTALVPVNQFQNTVTASTSSIVPAFGASPGATDVGLVALSLKTDVSNATWQSLRVDQAGTAADADVNQVKLYYDQQGLGSFDSSNLGAYQLVTSSGQSFGSNGPGSVLLTFSTPPVLGTTPKLFFLTVDLSTSATPARTVVVRASTGAFFSVNAPNIVDPGASFTSQPLTVNAPPVTVYMVGADSAPASFTQGSPNIPMLTLRAWTGAFTAQWTQLRITRTGTGQDSDITSVRLYRDADGDAALNTSFDERLATGTFSGGFATLSFSTQTLTVSTQTYFVTYDVRTTAVAGDTLGARLGAAGDVKVNTPNSVATSGFPLQSSASTVTATQA